METQTTFEVTSDLTLENSFTVLDSQNKVELEVTIGIKSEDYGWFEFYDKKTGGNRWHAEGGLWFEDKVLTDYDGVFDLPDFIIDKLKELGYDCSEMEE